MRLTQLFQQPLLEENRSLLIDGRMVITELTDRVKQELRDKWKQEDPSLDVREIDRLLDEWDRLDTGARDIASMSFDEVKQFLAPLIDQRDFREYLRGRKKRQPDSDTENYEPIHLGDNLEIYLGDSKPKCIKYGDGYKWCISRSDASNLYNHYRFGSDERVFYFVFDLDRRREDEWHAVVIHVSQNGRYTVTTSLNKKDQQMQWEDIIEYLPKLKNLQHLFQPKPLSDQEKDQQKFGKPVEPEIFSSFSLVEKAKYIEFGHWLTSSQQDELDPRLLTLYAKRRPGQMSARSWQRLKLGDFKYAVKLALRSEDRDVMFPAGIHDLLRLKKQLDNDKQEIILDIIKQDPPRAFWYAYMVIKGRWIEAEEYILQDPEWAYDYARSVIKRLEGESRWLEGESTLAEHADWAVLYAKNVLEGRWPEPHRSKAELSISLDRSASRDYSQLINMHPNEWKAQIDFTQLSRLGVLDRFNI